jgi:hypothetical protein
MKVENKLPKELFWVEPRWSYIPRLRTEMAEIKQILMRVWVWLRIVLIAILLTVLLARWAKRAMPDLEFDWAAQLALSIATVFIGLFCFIGLLWLIPPFVFVNRRGVSRLHGGTFWRRRAEIRRIIIDTTDPAHPRFSIEAADNKPFECGLGGKVSAAALASFLRETLPELTVEEKK